jgi:cytochrome c-type biogenesis protein CcmH
MALPHSHTQSQSAMKRFRPLAILLVGALLCSGVARAYTLEEFQFDNPAKEQEFRDLVGKLRCLVCQNESLAASQADLAQDLRKEVYGMMRAGKSKDEVIAFLVARYGDFVLYQPPVKPATYLLWFGPFLLLAIGGFFLVRALARQKAEPERELSDTERERIAGLMTAPGEPQDISHRAPQ